MLTTCLDNVVVQGDDTAAASGLGCADHGAAADLGDLLDDEGGSAVQVEMREYMRRGTLDHVLTQPVDSQVLVSLRHIGMANLADPVLGLVLAAVGVGLSGRGVGVGAIASFVLLLAAALVLL